MISPRAFAKFVFAGCGLALLPTLAAASSPWLPAPGEFYSEFRAGHASVGRVFDNDRNSVGLGAQAIAEERSLASYNEVGWKRNLSLVIAVPAVSRTLRVDSLRQSYTNTGLSDLELGLRYRLLQGPTALAVEADWKAPLGYDRLATPALGSGQQDITGLLLFGAPIAGRGFVQVASGYRYRFELPLDEYLVSGDLAVWVGPLLASGSYDYTQSVGTGDVPEYEIERHELGPRLTYRVDNGLDFFAGSTYTVSGRNQPRIDRYYLGVAVKQTTLNRLQGFLGGTRRP
jgi:hypothetical protein